MLTKRERKTIYFLTASLLNDCFLIKDCINDLFFISSETHFEIESSAAAMVALGTAYVFLGVFLTLGRSAGNYSLLCFGKDIHRLQSCPWNLFRLPIQSAKFLSISNLESQCHFVLGWVVGPVESSKCVCRQKQQRLCDLHESEFCSNMAQGQ